MKIIIIGAGKVGYNLAENLSKSNHDVIIIDKNYAALSKAEENLEVLCIKGSGVSTHILMEAGIDTADLLIAVTNSDEVNMVCCLTAKKLGVKRTIARIRDHEYANELLLLKEELELDLIINPEQAAADEIANVLNFSSAINVENFAKGRVKMIEIKVTADMPMVGKCLKDIGSKFESSILIGVVIRDDEVIVPNGEFVINENDSIYIIGQPTNLYSFCKMFGKVPQKIKNVMIAGGGRIAIYLGKLLTEIGMKVKIIEIERDKCIQLSELIPKALVIHGDGTDEELLRSENIDEMDAFIAMTGMDEENMMAALLAKQNGAGKVIAKISRINYISIIKNLGIDSLISPKQITSNQILKYVRGNSIESLYRIIEGQAEITEIIAESGSKLLNTKIKKLGLPKDTIIATIVRKNEVVIPHGNDIIKAGDRVIVISKNKNISSLDEVAAVS
ncbi:MAG: Trk system potassium transporter TrkA [Gracilibacteraceae bacterium]|nr:Trk system potassium transporter TrkA [Gracilibacteraceae bacterium]